MEMEITKETMNLLLEVLDSQKFHCMEEPYMEEQLFYYIGMKQMLDMIVSNGYLEQKRVEYSEFSHTHYIAEHKNSENEQEEITYV